jgi:hypothetical protein
MSLFNTSQENNVLTISTNQVLFIDKIHGIYYNQNTNGTAAFCRAAQSDAERDALAFKASRIIFFYNSYYNISNDNFQ